MTAGPRQEELDPAPSASAGRGSAGRGTAGRGRRPWRLAAALAVPVLVGTAVAVPWLHRLVSVPLAVQAVALRGVVAVGAAVAATAVAAAWLALRRPGRRVPTVLAALAAGLAALALTNVAVLGVRGTAGLSGSDPAPVRPADEQLVVLALNTQGNLRSTELAPFIAARHADLVMLPETNERTARATAAELADRGLEYQVLVEQLSGGSHPDTALLVGPRVGGTYRVAATGPAASFTASSDAGPPLTAVHTRAPVDLDPTWWSGSTAWAVESCAGRRGAIVAGDFNATLDHVPFRGLGRCVDAAEASGAAGVGTWPSALPRALAAPIDHVLVDGDAWRVLRARVLEPPRGTDHRALEAVIAAR